MPSSIDVSPTIGHALLTSQLGVGATPGYDSIDLRRVCKIGRQEGVHARSATNAWKVSQSATPAMSVDIAANVDLATVQGDAVTGQGQYVVAPHSATATLTIATADVTNPRLDQIVLQIYDTTYDGSGFNKATMMVVAGTPTGGATLANRNGAAALPGSALLLADVLVGAGVTTVLDTNIRDRRTWANGAFWTGLKSTGAPSRTSIVVAAIDTTNLQARIECSGVPVRVTLQASTQDTADAGASTGFWIDGTAPDSLQGSTLFGPEGGPSFSYVTVPAAGSHLFTATFAGDGTHSFTLITYAPLQMTVQEIIGQIANNGVA